MAIEETITRHVAEADWTDECTVVLRTRKKRTELTVAEAVIFAGEIVEAATAALDAAREALHPVESAAVDMVERMSPDCKAGKHPLHHDEAWDDDADVEVPCECPCHLISSTPGRAA